MIGLGQDQGQAQTERGLDARECLTKRENREIEQIQQMFSLDDKQTVVQAPLMDTDDKVRVKLIENRDGLSL